MFKKTTHIIKAILFFMLLPFLGQAQGPDPAQMDDNSTWGVLDPSNFNFNNTMTIIAAVNVEGIESTDADVVAAFINGEIRGLDTLRDISGRHLMALQIVSNDLGQDNGLDIIFRLWDRSNDLVLPIIDTIPFVGQSVLGTLGNPQILNTVNVEISLSKEDVLCDADNYGWAKAEISGGDPPYILDWAKADDPDLALQGDGTDSIYGLTFGKYYLSVTDANKLTKVDSVVIENRQQPIQDPIILSGLDNPICRGGDVVLFAYNNETDQPRSIQWFDVFNNPIKVGPVLNLPDIQNSTVIKAQSMVRNCVSDTSSYFVDVGQAAEAGFNVRSPLVEEGSIVEFTPENGEQDNYHWDFGDGDAYSVDEAGPQRKEFNVAGTYFVRLTTTLGECEATEQRVVTVIPQEEEEDQELVVIADVDHPQCETDSTGSIFVQVANGFDPIRYRWDTESGIGPLATSLSAGTYKVTITDFKNRVAVREITLVPELGEINLPDSVLIEQAACFGENITLSVVDDDPNASFFWFDQEINGTLKYIGNQITLEKVEKDQWLYLEKRNNGCTSKSRLPVQVDIDTIDADFSASAYLLEPFQQLELQANTPNDDFTYFWDFGNGDTDTSSGATASYSYEFPGEYQLSLSVSSQEGCVRTETITVQVIQKILELEFDLTYPVCATDASGVIVVQVKDGTGPFTYLWNTGETGPVASNLLPGTYQVEVRDANGNRSLGQVTLTSQIEEVPQAEVLINGGDDYCIGEEILLSAYSEQAGAEYFWYDGQNPSQLRFVGRVLSLTVKEAQSFLVETHYKSCVTNRLTLVNIKGTAPDASFTVSAMQTDIDTDIDFAANSIDAENTYEWNFGDGSISNTALATHSYAEGGLYEVSLTVTDANGCQSTTTQFIQINDTQALFALFNVVNVECIEDQTGRITASAFNGTPPYSFNWGNGSTENTITELEVGTYYLTVTDGNGDIVEDSVAVESNVGVLEAPEVINFEGDTLCTGRSTTLYAYTDRTDVTFLWYDQAQGGNILGVESPLVLDNLESSRQLFAETNRGGCASPTRTEVNIEVINPSKGFSASATTAVVGESISFTPDELTPGYSYKWEFSDGSSSVEAQPKKAFNAEGQYSVTLIAISPEGCVGVEQKENYITVISSTGLTAILNVTDVSCPDNTDGAIQANVFNAGEPITYNWSNGETTPTISGLSEGSYTVTIMDGTGLSITRTAEVGRQNSQPEQPTIALNAPSPICAGSNVTLLGLNGSPVDEYRWYDATGELAAVGSTFIISNVQENQAFQLQAVNGSCASEMSGIQIEVQKPNANFSLSPGSTVTIGEALQFTPEVSSYTTYLWQFGDGDVSEMVELEKAYSAAGSFTVSLSVTDEDGCSAVESKENLINVLGENDLAFEIVKVEDILCNEDATGSISVRGIGGSAPYTYSWSNDSTGATISSLSAGVYGFTITDSDQLSVSGAAEIENLGSVIPVASININGGDPACLNSDVFVLASSTAFPNATFEWYATSTSNNFSSDGNSLVLRDIQGDTSVFVRTNIDGCISEPLQVDITTQVPDADFSVRPTTNLMEGDLVQFLPNALSEDYSYRWDFGDNGWSTFAEPYYFYNMPGVYDVSLTVTDADGCEGTVVKAEYINVEKMEEPPGFAGGGEEESNPELRSNAENDRIRPIPAKVFPNPFVTDLSVLFKAAFPGRYTLELTDMLGQLIWSLELDVQDGLVMEKIPAEQLGMTNGLYLLQIRNEMQQTTLKVLKNE